MPEPSPATTTAPPPDSLQSLADRLMLEQFAPPAVLVSAQGDIVYISGRTGRFLEPAAGKANWNIHAMLREGLRPALMQALAQVRTKSRAISIADLVVDPAAGDLRVRLTVRPVSLAGQSGLLLILFEESRADVLPVPSVPARGARGTARRARDGALQQALEELQALREETQSSQEELQSANEELQSTNEELQSANEELTTSKEEMQAMNEELQTVNAELLSKLDDLALAQSDLKNLLNSTQIATLFLDGALNVRRFTEQAKKVVNLRDSDIGRPMSDLTSTLEYPALREDIIEVLRSLAVCASERRTADGRWYAVHIMPYRTQDNVIDGAVITFADISAAKALEAKLRLLTPPGSAEAPAAGRADDPA